MLFRRARVATWTLFFAATCLSACEGTNETAGSGGGAEDQSTTTASGGCGATLDGPCGECMKMSCCDALSACESDADCAACVDGSDSNACEKNEDTHARVDAYLSCKGGACEEACIGATTGACEGLLDGLTAVDCTICLEASCCGEVTACHDNAVCWDGCFTNHDETKCHGDPDGHALFHALGACASDACATECQ